MTNSYKAFNGASFEAILQYETLFSSFIVETANSMGNTAKEQQKLANTIFLIKKLNTVKISSYNLCTYVPMNMMIMQVTPTNHLY